MLMRTLRYFFGLAALALSTGLLAQQSTTILLTGVQFRNGVNQSRSSATPISPAFLYDYHIDGNARGVGGGLGLLFPSPTPIETIFETLAPGSSAFLDGQGPNINGTHPFPVANQRVDGSTVISGINVTYGFDLRIDIAANGIVSFSLTNVVLQPSLLTGYLEFTSGQVLIERTRGVIGGRIDLEDFIGNATLVPVTIELRNPGSTTAVATYSVNPTTAGTWFTVTALRGTYDVAAKASHWLRSRIGSVSIGNDGVMNLDFSLMNGDVDGDNEVTVGDHSILSSQFGTPGPEADLNGDGEVDIGDYSILSSNFGAVGDD